MIIDLPTSMVEVPPGQEWIIDMINNILIEVLSSIAEQEKLAEKLDVSTQYISDMERGVAGLSLLTMIDLSNLLSVSTDYLMKGTENPIEFQVQIGSRALKLTEYEYQIMEKLINNTLEAFKVNKNEE